MNKSQHKFDPLAVENAINALSSAKAEAVTRQVRKPRESSPIKQTLDALMDTVKAKMAEGMSKRQIYSEIVQSGIKISAGTWNKWLSNNGLVRPRSTAVAS